MLVRDSNGPLWGRKSLRSLLVLDSNNGPAGARGYVQFRKQFLAVRNFPKVDVFSLVTTLRMVV